MKLGSLFDGAGTAPLAAVMCGMEPIWASEIEPFPKSVTEARFPNMKHLGDVRGINGAEIEPVNIIVFGSPCQDLSIAGKRTGLQGERSGLFQEAIRIIKEMREATNGTYPAYAVWENVPGAFSSNKGADFRQVLQEFAGIIGEDVVPEPPKSKWLKSGCIVGDGYSIAWRILDAQFWGVPQRRRRIFLVADFAGGRAGEILFKPESLPRDFAPGAETRKRIAAGTEGGAGTPSAKLNSMDSAITMRMRSGCEGGGKGPLIQLDKSGTLVANNDQYLFEPQVILNDQGGVGTGGNQVPLVMSFLTDPSAKARGIGIGLDIAPTLRSQGAVPAVSIQANAEITQDISPTLNCAHEQPIVAYSIGSYNSEGMKSPNPVAGIQETDIARTVDASGGNPTCNQGGILIAAGTDDIGPAKVEKRIRRLTPTECARLQGMPDWWCADIPHSDTAEYKMWGNGMALPCIYFVLNRIAEIAKEPTESH